MTHIKTSNRESPTNNLTTAIETSINIIEHNIRRRSRSSYEQQYKRQHSTTIEWLHRRHHLVILHLRPCHNQSKNVFGGQPRGRINWQQCSEYSLRAMAVSSACNHCKKIWGAKEYRVLFTIHNNSKSRPLQGHYDVT